MKNKRHWIILCFIFIGSLIVATIPLYGKQFIPTHDGEYHVIRFAEFYRMLSAGYWFPRWAPTLNSGYGVPLFNFHYPFPNYIGALFHTIGVSFVDSFKLALALGYTTAAVASFVWLFKLFGKNAAFIGATLGAWIPYWFVDVYVRGSIGEVWALVWVLTVLAAIEWKKPVVAGFAAALIILSHNITAMIALPLLAAYAFMRYKSALISLIAGVGIASYFWIPALAERQFVTGLNTVNFRDHFPIVTQLLIPSWGTGFSVEGIPADEMSFQIGLVTLFLLGWSVVAIIREKAVQTRRMFAFWASVVVLLCFLMLEASRLIWQVVAPLQFIQYPWRFLSIFVPVTAFVGSWFAYSSGWKKGLILVAMSILANYSYARPVQYVPRSDEHYLSRREFTDGTSSIGNTFSTRWLTWRQKRADSRVEVANDAAKIDIKTLQPLSYVFTVTAPEESFVRVNTAYYPGWVVEIDGEPTSVDYNSGIISFTAPSGTHKIRVKFTETLLRLSADSLSLLSLFCLGSWGILANIYAHRYRHNTSRKRS